MKQFVSFLLNKMFPVRQGFDRFAIRSVVVFQFGHIGDIVLSLPFLKVLPEVFPRAKVTFVCGSWGREIVDSFRAVDEVVIFDHPWQDREGRSFITKIVQTLCFLGALRSKKYDLSIDLKGNLSTASINLFSGSKFKAGRDRGGYNYPYVFSASKYNNYEAINLLSLLEKFGRVEFSRPDLVIDQGILKTIKKKLLAAGLNHFLVIHPQTPWRPRNWGMANYCALARKILSDSNLGIAIIGSSKEKAENDELCRIDPLRVRNLSGNLSLMETAALISRAEFFIGSDSGPMHIAAAIGAAVLALMGPGEYPRFAPYNPVAPIRIIRHEICDYQRWNNCRQSHKLKTCAAGKNICMAMIKVDEVYAAAKELMGQI